MQETHMRIAENGRVVIPASFRQSMGIEAGDELVLRLEKDELRITTKRRQLAKARALVRRHITPGVSLASELIQERREAAKRE